VKVLFIGDVQGERASRKLGGIVSSLKRAEALDLVIINGENSADSNGITPRSAELLFEAGADVITTGNHAFKRKEADSLFAERAQVIRPANFGNVCPGSGVYVVDFGYCTVGVVNIIGSVFMLPCDNPFKTIDAILADIRTPNIIIDFHAEATSEKRAFAEYLAGRVSAVLGTHTHVQTADEQVIGGHTAFISDVGMVGAVDSIIGSNKNAIRIFTDYYPQKFTYPDSGELEFNAVIVDIDAKTGRAASVKRIKQNI
jgi:hypothetical protein